MKKLWIKYKQLAMLVAALAVLLVILHVLQIPCIIKYLTGVSCPGCGMTRACISALRLDFQAAFFYHPLWIALPFSLGGLLYCHVKHHRRAFQSLLWGSVALLAVVYLWRMFTPNNDILVFAPQNGAIVRFARRIFRI